MDTVDVVEFDSMIWGNLPRAAGGAWWRFVAGAGLPGGALYLLGLAGLDLGGLGLLEPLGLLDLDALGALHGRFLSGGLHQSGDPAAQCQGER